jgi:hypothetical protein
MSEINSSNFKKEHGDLAPDLVGVTELTSPYFFVPPSGTTAERPEDCEPGTLRFNTDIGSLEVFRGKTIGWEQIQRRDGQYLGGGTGSNTGTGTRAVISFSQDIDFFTISSLGDAADSGSDLLGTYNPAGLSDSTRGVFAITSGPAYRNDIDFITIQSIGTAVDFGDLTDARGYGSALASNIRGCFLGGLDTGSPADLDINIIDFVTISTTGNATDFGDLLGIGISNMSSASNAVRGIVCGGTPDNGGGTNIIQFITIATTGNAIDFGDLLNSSRSGCTVANSTRFVHHRGQSDSGTGSRVNVLEFSEIASTGDTLDFGDLVDDQTDRDGISNGHGGL